MPFIPVEGVIQSRLIWQEDNGTIAQNVFYNATDGPIEPGLMADLGELWNDLAAEALTENVTPNWALVGVNLRDMSAEDANAINYATGFPLNGSNAGGELPNQVSYTVTLQTPFVGRSQRGRSYGLGVPANAVQANKQLNPAAQAAFQGSWQIILDGLLTAGFPLQVVSFFADGAPRVTGRALTVTSVAVRFPLATQRRRLS